MLLIPLLLLAAGAGAVEGVQLALGRLIAPWGTLEGVSLSLLEITEEGARLELAIERIGLPEPLSTAGFSLECPGLVVSAGRLRCPEGELTMTDGPIGPQRLRTRFDYRPATDQLTLELSGKRFAGGRLELTLERRVEQWTARGALTEVRLKELLLWAARARPEWSGWSAEGKSSVRFQLSGVGSQLRRANLDGVFEEASLDGSGGSVAAAGLAGDFRLRVEERAADRAVAGELALSRGELYLEPLYWKGDGRPTKVGFDLLQGAERVSVKRLSLTDPDRVGGEGSGVLVAEQGQWRIREADLTFDVTAAGAAYRRYLKPLAVKGVWSELEVEGALSGRIQWAEGGLRGADLRFQRLYLDDPGGRLGLYGLNGDLGWSGGETLKRSELRWEGGHFLALDLGAGVLHADSRAGRLTLIEGMRQPLLDGALLVDDFELALSPAGALEWELDAVLTPLSMERLSQALGWPVMNGRVSGVIPHLRYRDQVISVDGDLLARLFDGEVLVRGLRLDHPFGPVCRVDAEVSLRRLDLDELTRTFAFGSIQGRLSGEVKGLRLEQWKPIAFDAWLATPADDDSRHRISQRAVENLSQLGGGAMGGALSRGFLGLFDEFGYDRIGIGCRLRDGICRMEGVAPSNGGYYLVKGGGLPRIDVIGYAREVDWDELLRRLRGVTLGPPEIR